VAPLRPAPPPVPPRANGRPVPDFSNLPPAIAESLARLAGAAEDLAPEPDPTPTTPPLNGKPTIV
jgi:hypothetical protein